MTGAMSDGMEKGSGMGLEQAGALADGAVVLLPLAGIGPISTGDDLAALIVAAGQNSGVPLRDGDVVIVASKVVSKAEGRTRPASDYDAALAEETVDVVAQRRTPAGISSVVRTRQGQVMAAAGIDNSNVAPGQILLLPEDLRASAQALGTRLRQLSDRTVAVVLSDTAGRAWRRGQVDVALASWGLHEIDDLADQVDPWGNRLQVTQRAIADEIASAADLVKGKLTQVPVAVVRGLSHWVVAGQAGPASQSGPATPADPASQGLQRPIAEDWFAYGHREAALRAAGVRAEDIEPSHVRPEAESLTQRIERALRHAGVGTAGLAERETGLVQFSLTESEDVAVLELQAPSCADGIIVGASLQRLMACLWAEGLQPTPASPSLFTARNDDDRLIWSWQISV